MRVDVTSMFFNSSIKEHTATAAWGTALGQSQLQHYRIDDSRKDIVDMIIGMTYKSVSDKEHLKITRGSNSREILTASVFSDVFINEQRVEDSQFVLVLVREHSSSHDGRLIISYSPNIEYRGLSNQTCIDKMQKMLGCGTDGCWFVYDISIKHQSELHFKAKVVNANGPMIYDKTTSSKQRSDEWKRLIPSDDEVHGKTPTIKVHTYEGKAIQSIHYGAPGTGKSYGIKGIVGTSDGKEESPIKDDNNIRITFHPDTDYASFVGCYKPMRDEDNPKLIVYKYQPQAFIKAYVNAWTIYLDDLTEDKNYYLIIEEINRGNCAQIFGDMFQLLDREDNGYSSYKVSPDSDLQMYLEEAFKDVDFSSEEDGEELKKGTRMQLPPNLSILATMNTSDQSLFPMDSAFKRRWDWDYVKIDTSKVKELYFKVGDSLYSWADFVNSINKYIQDNNGSTAKQIGPWFAKADADEVDGKPTTISYDKFCSKVLFYLFNDALRDFDPFGTLFQTKDDDDSVNFFFENLFEKDDKGVANVKHFLEELPNQTGINIAKKSTEEQADSTDEGQDD